MRSWWIALALVPVVGWAATAPQADEAALYREECGSCHLAFPAGFLTAAEWQRVLDRLDRHYGSDASLEETKRQTLLAYVRRTASNGAEELPGARNPAEPLPRLTHKPWFIHEHRKVAAFQQHPEVRTLVNCAACHTRAAEGSFREREIVLPGGRRWED